MKRQGLKTYSHLASARRVPSEYEVTTSRLLYYVQRGGFELDVPVAGWYAAHQQGSPLRCGDWDAFTDPRQTTYTSYVVLQRRQEEFADALLGRAADPSHAGPVTEQAWRDQLAPVLPVLRFVFHALQMSTAYVGQLAPGGRIVVACALQTADHVRRVHRMAQQMALLRRIDRGFGDDARDRWERAADWQPLRRALEQLLVTWDWGEAIVATNAVIGCAVDALLLDGLSRAAERRGDFLFAQLLASLAEDGKWHRDWTRALVRVACDDPVHGSQSRDAVAAWLDRWQPRVYDAVSAAAPLLGDGADAAAANARAAVSGFAAELSAQGGPA